MEATKTFVLCIVVMLVSSCGLHQDRESAEINRITNQYLREADVKYNEEKQGLAKDIADYKIKYNSWQQKRLAFLNSLSNEELMAYSQATEAGANKNEAKQIVALRNFMSLIKSDSRKKYAVWNKLLQEAEELDKRYNELDAHLKDIARRDYELAKLDESIEKDRKHEEMVSAIKGVGSSIDSMRFDFEQWKMQQFLGMR